jgi:Fatty acid hydroxylase superfamily
MPEGSSPALSTQPLASDTSAFRDQLRSAWSVRYSGLLHFAFTSTVCWAALLFALSRVHAPTFLQLCTVPITFFYANAVEYFGHKHPMHHRTPGLGLVHRRHTLEHHRFFTQAEMTIDGPRDVKMVLFPPVLILFFFGLFALPSGLALRALFGTNVAALFIATAMGYFLCYEWLHLSYHLGEGTLLGRLQLIQRLRRHHARHHDPARMTEGNFNITFPICDALFGTLLGPGRQP